MNITKLSDLMGNWPEVKIRCALKGGIVRTLVPQDGKVKLTAGDGTVLMLEKDMPINHVPTWDDRDNLMFHHNGEEYRNQCLKFCTAYDVAEFPDGTQAVIE